MNKQELIKAIETLDKLYGDKTYIVRDDVLKLVGQLDEPQKVTVLQFVADWIKYCKNTNVTMTRALLVGEVDFYNYANQKDLSRLTDFFSDGKNQEIFARAWLDGYTIEEKRYRVEMKGISSLFRHLKYNLLTEKWYMGNDAEDKNVKNTHTRKEIEDAGFGEVFNSPLFEVVEV